MKKVTRRRGKIGRRGLATVELAVVLPVLMLLLFGIMEMGMLFKDVLMLQESVREGARTAEVGAVPSQITSTVQTSAVSLNMAQMTITSQYRTWSGTAWNAWTTLGTSASGTSNNAPSASQIMVSASYNHMLIVRGLFGFIATDAAKTMVTINASSVVRRE